MRTQTLLAATFALVSAFSVVACSGSDGPAPTVDGDYVTVHTGQETFQEVSFDSATKTYQLVPVGCVVADGNCTETGTYDYDGSTLSLTDSATHKTVSYPVSDVVAAASDNKGTQLDDNTLVNQADGGSILSKVGTALYNTLWPPQLIREGAAGLASLTCPAIPGCGSQITAGPNNMRYSP